jgi:hypothetical protein
MRFYQFSRNRIAVEVQKIKKEDKKSVDKKIRSAKKETLCSDCQTKSSQPVTDEDGGAG